MNYRVIATLILSIATQVSFATGPLWFRQRLDHFNFENSKTWNQRYFASGEHYRDGGPGFIQIGGEGPANPVWLEKGHWIDIAEEVGAACFILEHRFYGESHPTTNTSIESLQYLTSEQALADLSNFISNLTSETGLTKWVVFGGSYSGSLSLWARMKYPHLIHGAMSASAPLVAKMDFFEYNEVVNRSLTNYGSSKCVESIAVATKRVENMLMTDVGRQQLQKTFNLCKPLKKEDDQYFQNTIADSVAEIVQYNRDNRQFEGATGGNVTISDLCYHMTNEALGDELERYASIPSLFGDQFNRKRTFSRRYKVLGRSEDKCVDASYVNFINTMRKVDFDASRTWVFQTCTEFGWFQSTDSFRQPFRGFPVDLFIDMCEKIYGPHFDSSNIKKGIDETNTNYGAKLIADSLTNAVLFNGGVDPWHALSYSVQSFEESTFHSLFVASSAHCAIMYPRKPDDPQELVDARKQATKYVKQWIN